ncbi:MAG: c-type cytochrome [Bacteroidota bacterium]|nr:c-type cytochrome [Bacteroidota bacterium]MDP4231470.1 c-type cytochrome [Bacteroidota bacterium]MDP4235515.1 c-type cytochrome [Bacteroidota bacterium]
MKKFFKVIGIILGCLVIIVAGFLGYLKVAGMPSFSNVHRPNVKVDVTPERVARGRKIVSLLCYDCHFNPATNRLSGHYVADIPKAFGDIYSHNITGDKTNGIGNWTDGEVMYFLRTGIHKNNEYVPPYMPKFPNVSDEDINSIVAFLRSDDTLVAPNPAMDTVERPSLLALFLGRFVFKPLEYPKSPIAPPPANDQVAIGKYWSTGVIGCYQCHSADFKTNDEVYPEKSVGFFGGGNELKDFNGNPVYSANLTMDPDYGLGKWTQENFVHALRDGLRPDNTALPFPMARFPNLTDSEIVAIYAYLKTVPVIHNAPKKSAGYKYADANPTKGGEVYYHYGCYACHGQTGIGVCDLTHAYEKYHTNEELITWIKDPSKIIPGSKMPTWQGTIREEEFLPLAEYVRQLGQNRNIAKAQTAAIK